MHWSLLHRRILNDSHFFCQVRYVSTNYNSILEEITNLRKVWSRCPPRHPLLLPADDQPYCISRYGVSTHVGIGYCLPSFSLNICIEKSVREDFPFPYIDFVKWLCSLWRYYLWAGRQLPLGKDLAAGCRQVFLTIIGAVTKRDLTTLDEFTAGGSNTLRAISKSLNSVSDTKLATLKVSSRDFLGRDGLCLNWNGFGFNKFEGTAARLIHEIKVTNKSAEGTPLDANYLVYTVYLATLYKKDSVYSTVRPYPLNSDKERAVSFMPKSYGYKTPKYAVMKLSMCHKMSKMSFVPFSWPQLTKDSMIYDFEISAFG